MRSSFSSTIRVCLGLGILIANALVLAAERTDIPHAQQPQLCASDDGTVWLTYGRNGAVFVAESADAGASFSRGRAVGNLSGLSFGMRRGPRIAAHGDCLTVTIPGEDLMSFSSPDRGKTWRGPVVVNETSASAREGLHDLAVAPDGRLFAVWLDQRNGATQLWGAESPDGGATWTKNQLVYRSPDKSICECCHPNALFDSQGNLAIMWRNSVEGSRDMWMTTRANGAAQFAPAKKLGAGTWKLNACPMDGGKIVALGAGRFASVWQRAGEVFFAPANGPEILLGKGKQPAAVADGSTPLMVWQQGTDLVLARAPGEPTTKLASDARFPVVVRLPGQGGVVVAYEQGPANEMQPTLVVEHL